MKPTVDQPPPGTPRQPREHPVPCLVCAAPTVNTNARCDRDQPPVPMPPAPTASPGQPDRFPPGTRMQFVTAVVNHAHLGDITPDTALDWLRTAQLTGQRDILSDALVALAKTEALADGTADPLELLEMAPSVRADSTREFAAEVFARDLAEALERLAEPTGPPAPAVRPYLTLVCGERL